MVGTIIIILEGIDIIDTIDRYFAYVDRYGIVNVWDYTGGLYEGMIQKAGEGIFFFFKERLDSLECAVNRYSRL